jgi:tRNA pseudouridine32 synthase/23S rRNA pseudouridine746 synthase
MPGNAPLSILLHDGLLLVLDKPSGLLAVPGRGEHLADCLALRAQALFPQALVVHRLDRDTSGVLVMALDLETQQALSRQFEERQVEKVYVAVVAGQVAGDAGEIDLPLAKDFSQTLPPRHRVDHERGRPAVTRWRVLSREVRGTRLELRPLTGRSHQLRVHLAELGHPILGDPIYADAPARTAAERLMLHAWKLKFLHPTTGEHVECVAPCPF